MGYFIFLGSLLGIFLGVIIGIPVVIFAKMRKSHEGKAKQLAITLAAHFEVNGKDEK